MLGGNVFGKYKKDGKDAAGLFVDNKHTKPLGSYLEACCIYRGIFKESPVGIEYYTALDQKNNKAEVTLKKASCKTMQEYANNYWNKSISSLGLQIQCKQYYKIIFYIENEIAQN